MKRIEALVILGVLSLSAPISAQTAENEKVFVHSFGHDLKETYEFANHAVNLQSGPMRPMTLRAKTDSMMQQWGLSPRVVAKQKSYTGLNLAGGNNVESLELRFSVDGIPLCQYQLKSHETVDGKMLVFGKIPKFAVNESYNLSNWPAQELVRNTVADTLVANDVSPQFSKISSKSCLWSENGVLHPVWVMEVQSDRLNYKVIADDQRTYKFQPQHFHATGKAKIYPHNVFDTATEEFTLRDMKSSGYLENAYFVTEVESPFDYVLKQDLDFTAIGVQDAGFEEVSLFTNSNRALEWLESMGYKNFGTTPIHIAVHAEFQGDTNNALYQPGTNYDVIYVGDGDGTVLQNLATDSDVVGHELGHHVVYHTVTDISGESLVLHEALADYFNFARTGNACLGESICPDTAYGNKICYVPKQCLRTAENSLKYTSSDLPKEAHQRSQFISGMLWDLYIKDGISLDEITHMVLKAIDFLVEDSGYQHFVVGMMLADQSLFQGAKCSLIYNRALDRGLTAYLSGITCDTVNNTTSAAVTDVTDVSGVTSSGTSSSTPVASTSSKSSKKSFCGVLTGSSSANGQLWSLLVLFILPLMPALIRFTTRK